MKKQRKYLFTLVGLLALAPGQGQAAEIFVDAGGTCTLADAIRSANENVNWGRCVGVGEYGDDTIYLETDVLLGSGEDERPPILSYENSSEKEYTGTVTIEGQGHVIDGNGEDGYVLKISTGWLDENRCIGGELTLNNTTITGGNHAHPGDVTTGKLNNGGGITNACFGRVTLNNSTVSGNIALGNGGGIFNAPWASLTLNNSTVSGNLAEGIGGGGVYNNDGAVVLNNSTVSDNIAVGKGGGICSEWRYGPNPAWIAFVLGIDVSVSINSSLVSGNTASTGNEVYESAVPVYADSFNLFGHSGEIETEAFFGFLPGDSDIDATSDGTSPTFLSAILSPLANNGGKTMTHALVEESPAVDLDENCSTGLPEDQRGEIRPGIGCDAGSFEFILGSDTAILDEIALVVSSLDSEEAFDNKKKQKALVNQIDATIVLVDEGLYAEALGKLQNSILGKTDGCVESELGEPDKNDWIRECSSQVEVYDLVQEAIGILEEQM
ncbi:MAG: choice-of-anchor Q domain-containing protein [Candidatus Electrothrix communis]|nr:MAG: choice-of-anchor Q domain-containing protein [Candidatus Electrothrix communis]